VGCTKISPGCQNCYAETMAHRLKAMGVQAYENGFSLSLLPDRLSVPLRQKRPTVFFVNSMSDLFHKQIPDDYVERVLSVIAQTPQHTYQLLTKRSTRMRQFFLHRAVPKNLWLGVSVEDRRRALARIPHLQTIRATVRFISFEPLLGDVGELDLRGIHWAIVGGESGHKARAMRESWAENVHRCCTESGAAFFFKQWGKWGADGVPRSKKSNGRLFKGTRWDELPVNASL
jgi:protein gp37